MADEEVDFEEAVDLGDAPMEESAGSGKKGRDATGRRLAIHTLCLPWRHILLVMRTVPCPHTEGGYCGISWGLTSVEPSPPTLDPHPEPHAG